MDHKSWLWRKKSTEKMIVASDRVNLSPKGNEEEMLLTDKTEVEKDLKGLNDKLSSALPECNAKDDTLKKQVKMAEEAMAGWEKAEAKAATLKKQLDEVLQQRTAGEERLTHLEAALKECMQQLCFVREEQEQRIHDAVMKASTEFEQSKRILEDKLEETSRRITKIGVENTHLSKVVLAKEKSIEDLTQQKTQLEADLNALMSRLKSTEKDNASLKYEVQVLEKELEIRNEEREFNRRTADASHKQHLESAQKIAKLESECQRLRLLVRKRLPGPAALAKMKIEVDVLGIDSNERRRRRTNSSANGFLVDSDVDNSLDTSRKQMDFLTEQLCAVEEENKSLKEALDRKANELHISRAMYAHTASKLSQVESHLDEVSRGRTSIEPSRSGIVPCELSFASMSDVGSDDKISCAESWASALITELEHFKHGKQRGSSSAQPVRASDISLMDDFVEMERLAIVSVDKQSGSPNVPSDDVNATGSSLEPGFNGRLSELTGREIIPVSEFGSELSNEETKSENLLIRKAPGWLQDIAKMVLEQAHAAQRKPDEILEDVRVALADTRQECPADCFDTKEGTKHLDASNSPHLGRCIPWKPADKSLLIDSFCGINDDDDFVTDTNNQHTQDPGKAIQKIIELVEGICLPYYGASETLPRKDGSSFPYMNIETPSDYMVRVFQWKISELSAVLQQFVHACYDLLNGKSDVNRFSQELSSALDWIMNHCVCLQDVSSMGDAIKRHLGSDEAQKENEADVGKFSEVDKTCLYREQLSYLPDVAAASGLQNSSERDELQHVIRDENKKLKDEVINIESRKKDLEGRLQSALDESESLTNQVRVSEQTIARLQTEVDTLKMSKAVIENHKDQMLVKEDFDTESTVAKAALIEGCQKSSSLEVELENKNQRCEELQVTCVELQLQHASATKKKIPNQEEENQLRSDWEITAASEKLAQCQEALLNLGKQLKALAAPSNTLLFDKVISTSAESNEASVSAATSTTPSTPKNKLMNQRSSLLDQMLAEDNAKVKDAKAEESEHNSSAIVSNGVKECLEKIPILNGTRHQDDNIAINSLAIVPSKKKGGGNLWRKLLWRRKKSNFKQPPLPVFS